MNKSSYVIMGLVVVITLILVMMIPVIHNEGWGNNESLYVDMTGLGLKIICDEELWKHPTNCKYADESQKTLDLLAPIAFMDTQYPDSKLVKKLKISMMMLELSKNDFPVDITYTINYENFELSIYTDSNDIELHSKIIDIIGTKIPFTIHKIPIVDYVHGLD